MSTDTDRGADLPVPDEVIAAWCQGADADWELARHDIRVIAAPVVAAVLREEADRLVTPRGSGFLDAFTSRGPYSAERQAVAARLRARADQLDG